MWLALCTDREGALWAEDEPGAREARRWIRWFDDLLLPFAERSGLEPRDRALLRHGLQQLAASLLAAPASGDQLTPPPDLSGGALDGLHDPPGGPHLRQFLGETNLLATLWGLVSDGPDAVSTPRDLDAHAAFARLAELKLTRLDARHPVEIASGRGSMPSMIAEHWPRLAQRLLTATGSRAQRSADRHARELRKQLSIALSGERGLFDWVDARLWPWGSPAREMFLFNPSPDRTLARQPSILVSGRGQEGVRWLTVWQFDATPAGQLEARDGLIGAVRDAARDPDTHIVAYSLAHRELITADPFWLGDVLSDRSASITPVRFVLDQVVHEAVTNARNAAVALPLTSFSSAVKRALETETANRLPVMDERLLSDVARSDRHYAVVPGVLRDVLDEFRRRSTDLLKRPEAPLTLDLWQPRSKSRNQGEQPGPLAWPVMPQLETPNVEDWSAGHVIESAEERLASTDERLQALIARADRLQAVLWQTRDAPVVVGPAPAWWTTRSPYCDQHLQHLGITPAWTESQVMQALPGAETEQSRKLQLIATPDARVVHDAFLYRISNQQRLREFSEELERRRHLLGIRSGRSAMLQTREYLSGVLALVVDTSAIAHQLVEDAVVILALLGDREEAIDLATDLLAQDRMLDRRCLQHNLALLYLAAAHPPEDGD